MALLFPSTTLYYHAYTTHFPKELCTKHHCTTYSANCNTKLAQNNLKLLYTEAFTDRKLWPTASFDTEKLSHTQWQQKLQRLTTSLSHHSPKSPLPSVTTSLSHPFYVIISCSGFLPKHTPPNIHTKQPRCAAFCSATSQTRMYLRTWQENMATSCGHSTAICNHRCQNTLKLRTHTQAHKESFTQRTLLHTASFYAEKLLHTANFCTQKAFTQRSCYTEVLGYSGSKCSSPL